MPKKNLIYTKKVDKSHLVHLSKYEKIFFLCKIYGVSMLKNSTKKHITHSVLTKLVCWFTNMTNVLNFRAAKTNLTKRSNKFFLDETTLNNSQSIISLTLHYRSSCSQIFFKTGVLKKFAIFTGKQMCWNEETPTQMFSCEYCVNF